MTRSDDAYVAKATKRSITIASPAHLDPDDCLGQLVFHELCHSLVEGIDALPLPDWGLDNASDQHIDREHACLRTQAALLAPHGLRQVFAPTTSFRSFYDQIQDNPLHPRHEATAAITALQRAQKTPWAPHLQNALRATAEIAKQTQTFAATTNLWTTVQPSQPPHPTGFDHAPWHANRNCADCAWHFVGGRGTPTNRCRQANTDRIDPDWPACHLWEPTLQCNDCGACCRAGYDSVTVTKRDPVIQAHPDLIVDRDNYTELKRTGDHCAALQVVSNPAPTYACTIYTDRPKPCRDLEVAGPHCLTARRRVGLTI